MLRLREHPLEEAFDLPPLPAVDEPDPEPEAPRHPLLRDDGTPIGLGAYCRMVTPAWSWDPPHLRYMDGVLDRVIAGELQRVIIEVPPRHGKSEKSTVRHPAYRLELAPALRIILAAYNADLAKKFSRKIRRIVRGRVDLSDDRNSAADWETAEGGGVRAVGRSEGVAGLPADLLLIDDPIKNQKEAYSKSIRDAVWEWYVEDLTTRLEPNAPIVLTMTRRHEDDLVGRILARDDAHEWTVVRFPALAEENDPLGRPVGAALWPERYDERYLARKRKDGEASFASIYQQRPTPASGLIFKREWCRFYTTRDHPIIENGHAVPFLPPVFTNHLQSWDLSFKDKNSSDKVSGQVWSRLGADFYLRDRVNDRMDFVATIKAVRDMSKKWPEATLKLVEDKANGPAVISALRSSLPGLVAVEPQGDKVARAHAVTPVHESGNVWLPHPGIAPWVESFILEHLQFPLGANDDDVDAETQAVSRLIAQSTGASFDDGKQKPAPMSEAAAVANERF